MMDKLSLAATPSVWDRIAMLRQQSPEVLAPQFRVRLLATIHECEGQSVPLPDGTVIPLDVVVHETLRVDELQRIYFEQGTSKAQTARYSWHFFGLAADVISRTFEWFTGRAAIRRWPVAADRERIARRWFTAFGAIAERNGLKWGGRWRSPDMPHVYFGTLRDTPSDISRSTYDRAEQAARKQGATPDAAALAGREAVWKITAAL